MEILHNSMISSAAKGHAYLIINHAVPVRARIFREKGPDDKKCPVCRGEEETIAHLYQDCPETRKVWQALREVLREKKEFNLPERTLVEQLNSATQKEEFHSSSISIIAWWHIWRRRNRVCFQNEKPTPPGVVAHAILIEYELSIKAKASLSRTPL